MADCVELPPIVWKSDFYGTPAAFELLHEIVDVYVADFKFGNDDCARQLAKIDRYVSTVTRNFTIATDQSDLIVRHLLLPGHFDCCFRPIVDHMARELPAVKFSLRDGYLPRWQSRHYGGLAHPLAAETARRARDYASSIGLRLV
jgi:putative pyruvate formate lyase activating enzyme